jgi:uncharacterized damage-inducible protein DinB
MLIELQNLRNHLEWADTAVLDAMRSAPEWPVAAAREFAHVLASEEGWLSRLEGRPARVALWPDLDAAALQALAAELHTAYLCHLDALTPADLHRMVSYRNSANIAFETSVRDILQHLFMHAQYHRGKVNLLLRQAGITPASVDYIGFIRGFPTAVTPGPTPV